MNKQLAIGVAAMGLMACGSAMAQYNPNDVHGYIGASAGQSDFRQDCPSTFHCDHHDTGWKAYAGSTWNDIWGVELGYTDFGKINAGGGDTKAYAGNLSLTAGLPLGDRFRVFAKGGGTYSRTDVSAAPLFESGKKTGWGYTYGLGAALGITPTVQVRLDWDRYNMDFANGTHDVDLLSAGLQVRF